jgi:protein-L-isoaspartate(D-aspartate) O-methyltransferase
MYDDINDSWNQRDQNMFETLQEIMRYRGQSSKAVVWAHNSHLGDARATEVSSHGEINLGQRVRETFGNNAYLIGFGTDHGTVLAASKWGGAMEVMTVQPSHADSYERLFHDVKTDNFLLPLRKPIRDRIHKELLAERLQRAIGTTYDPRDELKKHYIYVSLPRQFDEYIWFDETQAVKPLTMDMVLLDIKRTLKSHYSRHLIAYNTARYYKLTQPVSIVYASDVQPNVQPMPQLLMSD